MATTTKQRNLHVVVTSELPWYTSGAKRFFEAVAPGHQIRAASEPDELGRQIQDGWADVVVVAAPTTNPRHERLLARIRRRWPKTPLILMTSERHPDMAQRAQAIGANGYLHSESTPGEVDQALRAAVEGESHFPPDLMAPELSDTGARPFPPDIQQRLSRLTRRERQVMEMLGRGHSNREIADALGLREGTVRIYVHRVIRQLGLRNRVDVALCASRLASQSGQG
ncbi:response regulator transcription factor [Ferruginivarius sediminum]|uniref:DNA-binding response regulator n=1 Tax=Ferruginivarius sediminum TaxID=2661937 RepID=A0A369TEX7_9PROT|nr:response regulator transcription factor [Ferruginivarius sediminum]RDD63873.1 DNA-binding response regulator [Ferruginivarius sediminum]